MADVLADASVNANAVVHITCDRCNGDVSNCPSLPYVFRKSWAQLILEAPADLKRECQGWHWKYGGLGRPAKHPEEFWSAYYGFEYTLTRA